MEINLNTQTPGSVNFGMAIHSNEVVNKTLRARIKKPSELEKLNKIVEQQAKNDKVDINLMIMPDGKTLSANVYSIDNDDYLGFKFFKNYTENIFTKLFKGPVGFIEKAAKTAEKQAAKMREIEADTYEDIFNKMK